MKHIKSYDTITTFQIVSGFSELSFADGWPGQTTFHLGTIARVGISGTTAKSRQRKFVPSSHPGPFALVASSRKSQTNVGTLACFDLL